MRIAAWTLAMFVLSAGAFAQPIPIVNPVGGGAVLGPDSNADDILQALEARGKGLKDFTAGVSMESMSGLTGQAETLKGKFWLQYVAPGDARIRVVFDSRSVGSRKTPNFKREYLLEKGQLIERDYQEKLEQVHQVLKPGEKMDPLKLGEGPFPLPVGQDPRDVKRLFDATRILTKKDDPADTVHMQLVPKPNTQFERKFKSMDVWVDDKSQFPRQIRTADAPEGYDIKTTVLSDIKVNPGLGDKDFTLDKVQGWTVKKN
jgi:outer membrane lipoprotein-sorting protein